MPHTQHLRESIIKAASSYNQPIWIRGIAGLAIYHYFGHNKNRSSQVYIDRAEDLISQMVNEGTLELTADEKKVMPLVKW